MKILGFEIRRIPKPVHITAQIPNSDMSLGINLLDDEDPTIYGQALRSWATYSSKKGLNPFTTDTYMFWERVYIDAYCEGYVWQLTGETK